MKKFDSFCKKILNEEIGSSNIKTVKTQKKYIVIDLYDGSSEVISASEAKHYAKLLRKVEGDVNVWQGEEYLVVEV